MTDGCAVLISVAFISNHANSPHTRIPDTGSRNGLVCSNPLMPQHHTHCCAGDLTNHAAEIETGPTDRRCREIFIASASSFRPRRQFGPAERLHDRPARATESVAEMPRREITAGARTDGHLFARSLHSAYAPVFPAESVRRKGGQTQQPQLEFATRPIAQSPKSPRCAAQAQSLFRGALAHGRLCRADITERRIATPVAHAARASRTITGEVAVQFVRRDLVSTLGPTGTVDEKRSRQASIVTDSRPPVSRSEPRRQCNHDVADASKLASCRRRETPKSGCA